MANARASVPSGHSSAGVNLGDGQVAEGRLDLGLDREPVAVEGGRRDGLAVALAPGEPLVQELGEGHRRPLVPAGADLRHELSFDLLGLFMAARPLPGTWRLT